MEDVSLLTQKHLLLHTTTDTDKHGVPPTKRLFKVAMLDPSPEFIGPWGTSGDPGQPRLACREGNLRRPEEVIHEHFHCFFDHHGRLPSYIVETLPGNLKLTGEAIRGKHSIGFPHESSRAFDP
ncbi:hypothetical protein Tco_0407934 [Tanacetum coccineum]